MILLLLAFAGQQTVCNKIGNTTRCEESQDPVAIEQPAPTFMPSGSEGAKERRARAYAQVGALIAEGRCEDAARLAKFYGQSDIIKDTARACVK